jgi:DNA replication licensing factor MCM3
VEGIVTKCSSVRPKLVKSVHLTEKTGMYSQHEYRDASSLDIGFVQDGRMQFPTQAVMPSTDANGEDTEVEHGWCQYKDCQVITLQEMPERARVGQLPRSVEVLVEHDLVDHVKPGDRVQCIGVYRPQSRSNPNGTVKPVFGTQLLCNSMKIIGVDVGGVKVSPLDAQNIRAISERADVVSLMASSLCPSIFGHENVKKALILQLLGGCEKTLENGTHLRGDVNCLLVGDPSTAKSQLLRSVLDIAPLAISSTGRGSSGVGLTAAVTVDAETREKRLEAGAMVLADRGCVCIDEFDKMSENDRVAIHEVMEQQTVTIAKAGLHASLNARCSVVAAANPVYGQYDKTRRPQENIGLPDSLLSRFDLLFIILDQLDPALDRTLSEHVIRSHQYRRPGTVMEPEPLNAASVLDLEDPAEQSVNTPVWQRGGRGSEQSRGDGSGNDVLTKDFLRKYIYFAKKRSNPVLSEDAMETISSNYATMRAKSGTRNLPVTARTLETIIRVATAHAKARIADSVEVRDVDVATELINFCLFHEISDDIVNNGGGHRRVLNGSGHAARFNHDDNGGGGGGGSRLQSQMSPSRANNGNKKARLGGDSSSTDVGTDENGENGGSTASSSHAAASTDSGGSSSSSGSSGMGSSNNDYGSSVDVRALVIGALQDLQQDSGEEGISREDLLSRMRNNKAGSANANAVDEVLNELVEETKIYVEDDGTIQVLAF